MEEIQYANGLGDGFFVPNPSNESVVYYFATDKYYTIDLNGKKIIDNNIENIVLSKTYHIAVHHAECDKIWLIHTSGMSWHEYLLTDNGVEKKREIELNPTNYKYIPKESDWQICLSRDCEHKAYSA